MATFFATDGSYGFAENIVIVDTGKWTIGDWLRIEQASDYERSSVAAEIASKYKMAEIVKGENNG